MKMLFYHIDPRGGKLHTRFFFYLLGEKNMYTKAEKEETESSSLIVKLLE